MARPKKDSEILNIRLDAGVSHRLSAMCADTGQTKTTVVERALQAYIDDYYDKQEKLRQIEEGLLVPVDEKG